MKILIVEDDTALRNILTDILTERGYTVEGTDQAIEALDNVSDFDVLVTDVQLPDIDGLDLLREAKKLKPALQAIVMTGYGSIPSAVEAMKRGARMYLTKPFDPKELLFHLREIEDILAMKKKLSHSGRGDIVGSSSVMQKVYGEIDIAAGSDAPSLITGETGTGKELVAKAIHDLSARKNKPYIAVNLGAIPSELAENELFGHEKGAFTGAEQKKQGLFSLANEGTLLLDELDSLPLHLQPKLLRAIETNEIWPIGAEQPKTVNVRIIAATNADLENLIESGQFRKDLFYRMNVLQISLPPLTERLEDIPAITRVLLNKAYSRLSSDGNPAIVAPIELSAEALWALLSHDWPGNIRELKNIMEKVVARTTFNESEIVRITTEQLGLSQHDLLGLPFKEAKLLASEEWSKRTIRSALAVSDGNVSKAARLLQMNQNSLFRLLKKYDIKH